MMRKRKKDNENIEKINYHHDDVNDLNDKINHNNDKINDETYVKAMILPSSPSSILCLSPKMVSCLLTDYKSTGP